MSCQGGEAVSASNVTTIDQSWLSRNMIHACEATLRVHRARFRSKCDVAMEDLRRPGTSSPGGSSHATGGTRTEESGGASNKLEETDG